LGLMMMMDVLICAVVVIVGVLSGCHNDNNFEALFRRLSTL
jgi:outer membrane murein-binding lipoprotein Lpp